MRRRYAGLTFVLSLIAAVLAISAALIRYVKTGEVMLSIIAAGVFLFAFGLSAWSRRTSE